MDFGLSSASVWLQIPVLALLFYIVTKSSNVIIDSASALAKRLGVSELIIGLTVVAIGTSAPEFAVTGFAALNESSGVALGNVIGSNIFNVGIILAMFAIYKPIKIPKELLHRDVLFLILATITLTVFCYTDGTFSRMEGIIFLCGLASYLAFLFVSSRRSSSQSQAPLRISMMLEKENLILLGKLALGVAILVLCSKGIVEIAIGISRSFGISEWIIGSTIVAAGTSLPELVTAIASIAKKKTDIGVGNIIGSELFNILGVIGLAGILNPMGGISNLTPFYLLVATILFLAFAMRTYWTLSRFEGLILIGLAVLRWTMA